MEENINNKKYKTKYLLKLSFCFVLLLIVFLLPNLSFAVEGEAEETQEFIYLSDYSPMTGKDKSGIDNTKVGYGSLHLNRTDSGAQFSIRIEDGVYSFQKGIWAHAGSIVTYDLTNYQQYDYFTTYMGVNTSSGNNGNGVTFKIFTSKDGANWELKTDANPPTIKSGNNAIPVKIPIKGEKYLRLVANDNGKNGNDHSVYVEPKLIKKTYVEPGKDLVPSITDLDTKIKEFASSNADLSTNSEYKLTLLKRELISRVGEYGLRRFLLASDINKATFEWLTGDVKVLEYFILGGEPEGGYYNSAMKKSTLPSVLNTYVKPAFGSHVLTYNTLLSNSVNATAQSNSGSGWQGSSTGWGWYESQIDLMSEKNVYGADAFSSSAYDTGIDNRQYAIFQLKPEFINTNGKGGRFSYWLKNVSGAAGFAIVGGDGGSSSNSASFSGHGVRPRFLIG